MSQTVGVPSRPEVVKACQLARLESTEGAEFGSTRPELTEFDPVSEAVDISLQSALELTTIWCERERQTRR